MTTEEKPLRSLFTDPDQAGDLEAKHRGRLTPLKVVREARRLDPPLGRILVEIFKRGGTEGSDLANKLGIPERELERCLAELELQGYIGIDESGASEWYFVSGPWDTQEFPSGPLIPLVYQFNLLSDHQRLGALKQAIDATVEDGDVVADLGSGAGVLTYLAYDTADRVYAVEVNREVHERGKRILDAEGVTNVEHLCRDARNVELPEKADVVICEMLDTALVAELQIPVMNHAVENILREDGQVIPCEAKTTIQLIKSDYSFYGGEFRLPHFEEYGSRESVSLSEEKAYHRVRFDEVNDEVVEAEIRLETTSEGTVNGIQLKTKVRFAPELPYVGASPWLNAPFNLPLGEDINVEPGDELVVNLRYRLGGGLSGIEYSVKSS